MSGIASSQDSLTVKTRYQNKNAVIITEPAMDSISLKYIKYYELLETNETLNDRVFNLELQSQVYLSQIVEKTQQNQNEKNLNKNLTAEVSLLNEKLNGKDLLLEQKSKEKLPSFLLGTAVGAALTSLIVLILSLN